MGKLRIPFFEIRRMITKAFETKPGKYCITKPAREYLTKRYLNDDFMTITELAERLGKKPSYLLMKEQKALDKIRRFLQRTGNSEYITELQPTV